MAKYPKARVVPFSSVVGSSVTLHDPDTGRVIAQLGIMNVGGDNHEDWKQRSILVAEDTAKRINEYGVPTPREAELEEALRPFASVGEALTPQSATDDSPWATAGDTTPYGNQGLTFGDFRRARRALNPTHGKESKDE